MFTRCCLSGRTEGQSLQPLENQGGGLGPEVNSSQPRQMERHAPGKQLEPTTAGLEPSASPTRSSQGALGFTGGAKPDEAAANFPANTDVCLRWKTQKYGLNQSGSRKRCVPRRWQDTEETLGWDFLLTPRGSGRQGSG